MRIVLFSLAIASVLFSSCMNSGSKNNIPLQHSDETYNLIEKGDGEKPEPGEFSVFSLLIKGDNGDTLLDRTNEINWGRFQIPKDSSEFRKGSPVDELLTILVEGDSATLIHQLDSLEKKNPVVIGMESIIYEIRIKEVITEEVMIARANKENAALEASRTLAKEKEAVIAKRVEELLNDYNNGAFGDKLITTVSGMEYVLEEEGTGPKPKVGDICEVHYYGVLASDGSMFDNSYQRGDLFSFPVGQGRVIQGWDEALLLMNKGTSATFFIPYELAYGVAGRPPRIPEKAKLVFYIEYP